MPEPYPSPEKLLEAPAPTNNSLGKRSIDAALWGAGGTIVRLIIQVGTQITLARILGPEYYGLFAIGVTVITLSTFLSDIGLAYGLIQLKEIDSRDIRFVFTWQILLGLSVSTAVFLAAERIAIFYDEPRSKQIVEVLSLLCLINALTAPSLNLLKRNLKFKQLQIAQLCSYIIGYIVIGLPLAYHGAQAWSLVIAWLVQSSTYGAITYAFVRHEIRPLIWYERALQQYKYGGLVLVTNLVNWAIGNIDRVVIGRLFGSREIGLYSTTYNLLYQPTTTALGVVQPVLFAASARTSGDDARILTAYQGLVAGLALFILPAFTALAVLADPFILTVYGSKWNEAAALCYPLALAMPIFLLFSLTTPLLWSTGHARREFQVQAPMALLWLIACIWAAEQSINTVAWMVLALSSLRCAVIVGVAVHVTKLTLQSLWLAVRGGILITLIMVLTVSKLDQLLNTWMAWERLLVGTSMGAALVLVLLRLCPWTISPELSALLARLIKRLPRAWANRLAFLIPAELVRS